MLRRLYLRMMRLAAREDAPWWLAAVSFAESSFLPLPPDPLLLAMTLARPERAWLLAAICTAASVAGGVLGYGIGYAAFDLVGRPLLRLLHYEAGFVRFQDMVARYGFWIIMGKGLTPIPFKIVTIGSGVLHYDFGLFLLASVVTRGGRFFLIAAALRWFGERARVFIEARLAAVLAVGLGAALLGLLALRFV